MTYLVSFHSGQRLALVSRRVLPECTMVFSRQDGGEWTTTGPVWLQPPTDAGFVELVIAEARAALLLRLSGDGRAPE